MKLNETRESAHLRSRVTDLSVVPNLVSYNALLACITPLASQNVEPSEEDNKVYKPMLIRDVDTLIANFGDPRIDPEKYVDLYAIMRMINNGGTCYLAKVYSGNGGKYLKTFNKEFNATQDPSDGNTYPGTTDQGTTDDGEYIIKIINTSDQGKFPDWKLVKPDGGDGKTWHTVKPENIHAITGVTLVTVGEGEPVLAPLEIVTGTPSSEHQVQINPNKFDSIQQITFTFSTTVDLEKNHLLIEVQEDNVSPITIIASSALDSEVEITYKIASLTPSGIKTVCLFVEAKTKNDGLKLGSTRVVLTPTLTNGEIISALNSKLGTYIHFDLAKDDQQYADCALSSVDGRNQYSIVKILNCGPKGKFFVKNPATDVYEAQTVEIELTDTGADTEAPGGSATFNVDLENYRKALDQYKDKCYGGCILADMTSKVTEGDATKGTQVLKPMSNDELRTLHYYLKGIAAERKDCTVLLSTPEDIKTISGACDFALSQASDSTKWEYGETPTTDYTLQSFYLEMYYPWLKIKCTKLGSTTPVSVNETIAPTAIVLDNILKSYRERGVHYPVAGDQYGQLSDTFSVINNPKTKFDRDQLVRARINPIWDTGKRGIQIYGNETLNAGYTDLNAAHIARTLVYIRNKIDEYTETLKFNINSVILWNRWKSYVSDYILEPLKSENALSDYEVMMGEDTTTREEIANRMLKGKIKLIFYQSAEIFDLDYIVYSSSNVTIADAESQI